MKNVYCIVLQEGTVNYDHYGKDYYINSEIYTSLRAALNKLSEIYQKLREDLFDTYGEDIELSIDTLEDDGEESFGKFELELELGNTYVNKTGHIEVKQLKGDN